MNPYADNPFLRLWLPIDASARDIRRRAEDMEATGDFPKEDLDGILGDLSDPMRRLWHGVFWFWTEPADETRTGNPFATLPKDRDEALQSECDRWLRVQEPSGDASGTAATARHNQAVAAHSAALAHERKWHETGDVQSLQAAEVLWTEAVPAWVALLHDDAFWDAAADILGCRADPRLGIRALRELRRDLPAALIRPNLDWMSEYVRLSRFGDANRHVRFLRGLLPEGADLDDAAQDVFAGMRRHGEMLVRKASESVKADARNGGVAVETLLRDSSDLRELCLVLLPCSHSLAAGILDDIADNASQLLVAYGNETYDWMFCVAKQEAILVWTQDKSLRETLANNLDQYRKNLPAQNAAYTPKTQTDSTLSRTPPKVDALHRREFTGRRVEPQPSPTTPPPSNTPPKVDALHRREFTGRHVETPPPPEPPPPSNTPPGVDDKYRKETFRRDAGKDAGAQSDEPTQQPRNEDVEEVEAIPVDRPWHPVKQPLRESILNFLRECWLGTLVLVAIILFATIVHVSNERQKTADQEEQRRAETDRLRVAEASRRAAAERALWDSRQQPLPANGDIRLFTTAEADSPFQITAPFGSNYYLKLVSWSGKRDIATIFIRTGTTTEVFVPSGTYEVRYAWGAEWYGPHYLFGPGTGCAKADQSFTLTPENGYTLVLRKVENGNLRTVPMRLEDF